MAPAGGPSQKAADLQIDDRDRLPRQIEIAVSRTKSNLSRVKSQRSQTTYKVSVGGTTPLTQETLRLHPHQIARAT